MSTAADDDADISYALVCLKTGAVLGTDSRQHAGLLEDLAAASPELFMAGRRAELTAIFTRLGSQQTEQSFQEIVLVSRQCAHVVQRLPGRHDTALLAVCRDIRKLALVRACVRARAEREATP